MSATFLRYFACALIFAWLGSESIGLAVFCASFVFIFARMLRRI